MKLVTQNERAWLDGNVNSSPNPSTYGTIVTANKATDLGFLTDNSGGATADGTIGVVTAPSALTNNTGGTVTTTLALVAAGTPADLTAQGAINAVIANALASLASIQGVDRTAIIALTDATKELSTKLNALIGLLISAGIML